MSGGKKLGLGVLVVGLLLVIGVVGVLRSDRGVPVRTEAVSQRDIIATITATGQVRARRQVNISSDVMGRVVQVNVVEGQEVAQGDLLLTIDPRQVEAAAARARAGLSQAEAQVAQQRANLLQAERELARLGDLRAGGVVTAQSLEEAQTRLEVQEALLSSSMHGVEQARAALEEAEDQLSRTTIRAPISGRVIRLNIEEGETAVVGTMNNPGSLLLTIGDLSVIEAVMSVDETDVPRISVGDSAVVELDAFPEHTFAARVSTIGNSSIQASGTGSGTGSGSNVTYEVVLTLLDPPANLRPDLSATADIIVDQKSGVPAVPIIAVTLRTDVSAAETQLSLQENGAPAEARRPSGTGSRGAEGVFVVRDGRAVWTPVRLGITGQEYFEIISGLEDGDVIVSGPYQTILQLGDGDPVTVETTSPNRP
jgi:HlyD family secretion protein